MLTHDPEQNVDPLGHATTHVPPEHAVPDAHTLPQPPQFTLSDPASMQRLPHIINPGAQVLEQTPPPQAVPGPQACPQPPQFVLSLARLVQICVPFGPGQAVSPDVHWI